MLGFSPLSSAPLSASDLSVPESSDRGVALSGASTLAFVGRVVAPAQFSSAGVTALNVETSDRAAVFSGQTSAAFINPDRAPEIAGQTTVSGAGVGFWPRAYSGSSAASFAAVGEPVHARAAQFVSASSGAFVGEAEARAMMRGSSKTKLDFRASFHKHFSFNVAAGSVFTPKTIHRGDMRMRARSRTIMRFRSGPWPW